MLMNVAKLSVEGKEVSQEGNCSGKLETTTTCRECALAGVGRILGMWMGQSRVM